MNVFTDVYQKSIDLLKTSPLDASWKSLENGLKITLGADGPDATNGGSLEDLRAHLKKVGKGNPVVKAAAILAGSKEDLPGFQERAALIKIMQHFYLIQKKGSQSIWVVDPPKAYSAWAYDQFAGKKAADVKAELAKEEEVFGDANRRMMSDALQLARKWSADVQIKLAMEDDKLLGKVRRWFHEENATDNDVSASVAILLDGFKKITHACNSNQVIFSDRPNLRASGRLDHVHASVNPNDVMPIIYIYQAFLRTGKRNFFGRIPELWICAITVIHELSHKMAHTEDFRYEVDGLRPGAGLPSKDALKNAESWAFFAADLAGALKKDMVDRVLA